MITIAKGRTCWRGKEEAEWWPRNRKTNGSPISQVNIQNTAWTAVELRGKFLPDSVGYYYYYYYYYYSLPEMDFIGKFNRKDEWRFKSLGCCTVSTGTHLRTFRRYVVPSSYGLTSKNASIFGKIAVRTSSYAEKTLSVPHSCKTVRQIRLSCRNVDVRQRSDPSGSSFHSLHTKCTELRQFSQLSD
jgi:hypothetical protein